LALAFGTRLGVYEVIASIGEGGMGQVYRATDTTLGRQVAIKILPDAFAADPERLARFEREAKTLASLNHPHIAAIYGFEKSAGMHALVMELVEGDDLSQRIARGAIPLEEALPIARQIADALEAAHEQGIVHRDLKPANIKVRADGTVKVLDFGLAKGMEPAAGSSSNLSRSPTLSMHATQAGIILGTAAYMAPEQARGKTVDKRADIWAFGVVLFEMLTGSQPFPGEDISHVLARVIERDPDWSALPPVLPPALEMYLRRCLVKDPRHRIRDIGDVRLALEGAFETTAKPDKPSWRDRIPWIASAMMLLLVAGGGALLTRFLRPPAVHDLRTTFAISPPDKAANISKPAFSPDGRNVLFLSSSEGHQYIFVRPLDSPVATRLAGTDAANFPFWSPDSRQIGFFSGGKLKKIDAAGGLVQAICDAKVPAGGTWNRENIILFGEDSGGGIKRVPASGGSPTHVLQVNANEKETDVDFPSFLPDGRHFLYFSWNNVTAAIGVAAIDGSDRKLVLKTDSGEPPVAYVAPGYLMFARLTTALAQRFDATKLELMGEPVSVMENVGETSGDRYSNFSVSATGDLVYLNGNGSGRQLAWFGRDGKEIRSVGPAGSYYDIVLSPDEKKAAMQRVESVSDIWLMDLVRGVPSRFTFNRAPDNPTWSPDGSSIIFSSPDGIYRRNSNGAESETLLAKVMGLDNGMDWSPDGKNVVFSTAGEKTGSDLWILPLSADAKPYPFIQSEFEEKEGFFSPDGRLIAYVSDESGRNEVYVQTFPRSGGKWQVSTSGGAQPHWRRDGKEMFYLAPDRTLMSVDVKSGAAFDVGTPKPLFSTRVSAYDAPNRYAVSADGQRFLVNSSAREVESQPLTVVLNWAAQFKK
jgi:eukaryotic-like serine/threonine-protein kinase